MFVYILMWVLLQDNVIISLLKWHSFLLGKFSDPYSPKHEEEHPRKHNTPVPELRPSLKSFAALLEWQ